jgi:outer membrane receptor protein involved in Fe transport
MNARAEYGEWHGRCGRMNRTGCLAARWGLCLLLAWAGCLNGRAAERPAGADTHAPSEAARFRELSLEDLMNLDVTAVTATRVATRAVDLPADNLTVFTQDFTAWSRNAVDALAAAPGIKVNTRQADHLYVMGLEVRGLTANETSGNNVLVLLDGIPQRRLSYGGPYSGALPFDAVSRLELVKGPLGSLYGRGALAGALQLFTDSGQREWQVTTASRFEDSTDLLRGALRVGGPLSCVEGGTFGLTIGAKQADGWQPRTASQKRDAYVHVRCPVTSADTVSVVAGFIEGAEEQVAPVPIDRNGRRLAGVSRDENLAVPGQNALDVEEYRVGANWEHRFDETLRTTLALAYWHGDTYWHVGRPADAPATGTVLSRPASLLDWEDDSLLAQGEVQKSVEWRDWLTCAFTVGASFERLTWENVTRRIRASTATFATGIPLDLTTRIEPDPSTWVVEDATSRDTEETDSGGFVRTQFEVGKRVILHGGVRYDGYTREQENRTTGNKSSVSEDATCPMAGIVVRVLQRENDAVNGYFTWGRGFSPVFRAVGTTEITDLEPETSESFEAGVKSLLWGERFEGTLALYQLERQDVVANVGGVWRNSGEWLIQGVETGLRYRPIPRVDLYASYAYREPKIANDPVTPANEGNDLAFVSRLLAKAGVAWRPTDALRLDLAGRLVSRAFADAANAVRLPEYWLLDMSVAHRWKSLDTAIFVSNVLDEEYYSDVLSGVVNGSAFEGPPRTFGVRIGTAF